MLHKQFRLTKSKDFKRIGIKGHSAFGRFMTMRVIKSFVEIPKVAFITSTKAFKKAVDRNRIKRRMREIVRHLISEIPKNTQLIFIIKTEALNSTHQELIQETNRLLSKIPETLSKPPKPSPRAIKEKIKRESRFSSTNT